MCLNEEISPHCTDSHVAVAVNRERLKQVLKMEVEQQWDAREQVFHDAVREYLVRKRRV